MHSFFRLMNTERISDKTNLSYLYLANVRHFHHSQQLSQSSKKKNMVRPYVKLDPDYMRELTHVTGVAVAPYSVGWATFNLKEDNKLTNFDAVVMVNEMTERTYSETQIYDFFKKVKTDIPESDLYVLENFNVGRTFDLEKVFQAQSISMLMVLLNESHNVGHERNKVLFHKSNIIDSLYGLRVDRERISSGQKLQNLLNNAVSTDFDLAPDKEVKVSTKGTDVKLPTRFLNKLFTWSPVKRDVSAHAFLLALSFIRLNTTEKEAKAVEEQAPSSSLLQDTAGTER